jgi:hypothetical protein
MIDTMSESVLSLAHAASTLPRRRGRKPHVSTLHRWATSGCRGVVLETIQLGGTRCTSRQAMQRFFERLSEPPVALGAPSSVGRRSVARRLRASAEAGRKLAESGA